MMTSSASETGQNTVEAKPPMIASMAMAWRARLPAICASAMLAGVFSASVEAMPIAAQQRR